MKLWMLGEYNTNYGGLGLQNQSTNLAYSSPVQIPGTTWKYFKTSIWSFEMTRFNNQI